MKKVISSIEVVDEGKTPDGQVEVCARADSNFDEERGMLEVQLDSFVRPIDFHTDRKHWRPYWLPAPQVVREHLALEEAMGATKEIFRRWSGKIRRLTPSNINH